MLTHLVNSRPGVSVLVETVSRDTSTGLGLELRACLAKSPAFDT